MLAWFYLDGQYIAVHWLKSNGQVVYSEMDNLVRDDGQWDVTERHRHCALTDDMDTPLRARTSYLDCNIVQQLRSGRAQRNQCTVTRRITS